MSNEWKEYVSDPRTICKYGYKCYQKNTEHHNKYKHPPLKKNRTKRRYEPYSKQIQTPKQLIEKVSNEIKIRQDEFPSSTENHVSDEHEVLDHGESNYSTKKDNSDDSKDGHNDSEGCNNTETAIPGSFSKEVSNVTEQMSFHEKTTHPTTFKDLFLVEMSEDFFKFFECFYKKEQSIESILGSVNLELIGPCDLLLGKLPKWDNKEHYLTHWRFFYDPPEFQAVLKKKNSEFHIGYFRDDPNEKPVFVGSNDSAKDCVIKPMAYNIFGAVYVHLQNEKKRSPFSSVLCQKVMNEIKKYADENNISLEEYKTKLRQSKVVTKTFHGAGIVVPYDKKTQLGYRHLVETDANLKKLFDSLRNASSQSEKDKILSELQPVITYASIAVDECDFGTGLEVGIDLFCSGLRELEPNALSSLTTAYTLLNRTPFSDIIKAHLKNRRRGPLMSMLN